MRVALVEANHDKRKLEIELDAMRNAANSYKDKYEKLAYLVNL